MSARADAAGDAVARLGRQAGDAHVRSALASRSLRIVDTEDGRHIVPEAAYSVHERILEVIEARRVAFRPPPPGDLAAWASRNHPDLDADQREALRMVVLQGTCLMNGGPGTGKTRVLAAAAAYLRQAEPASRIVVTAFSARIAMSTARRCGAEGFTTHALTGTRPGTEMDNGRTIHASVGTIFLDEAFSTTPEMVLRLLRQAPREARVCLCGDETQILPIGGGRAVHDLLSSKALPGTTLRTSHRLGPGSHLAAQRDRIMSGLRPSQGDGLRIVSPSGGDPAERQRRKASWAAELYRGSRAAGLSCVVLTTTQFGPTGHVAINRAIAGCDRKAEGDEVITTARHPRGLWRNGQRGIVRSADGDALVVDFDDGMSVEADARDPTLALGYAFSGHRGQGLEYDRAVVILDMAGRKLLNRQYLVSTLSRARDCILIAEAELIAYAASRDDLRGRAAIMKSVLSGRCP